MSNSPENGIIEVAILDDEENMGKVLGKLLRLEGYRVEVFSEPKAALEHVGRGETAVLLSDLRMPGMSGEEVLEETKALAPQTEVILMTAFGTVESAMRCVRAGAFDYVTKPFETPTLLRTVREAANRWRPADAPPSAQPVADEAGDLLGRSPSMRNVLQLISRYASASSAVLVYGESGTGKELAARALHQQSPRARERFLAINCASIPEHLMESELFGHERGAFTGANEARMGVFEAAHGGTLFLDEIGELPVGLQAKLLRVLQEKELTRVGSVKSIAVDVRIVAATNRRLEDLVAEGLFREDLYYRLNVLVLKMPPLRERPGDIAELAEAFAGEFARREGRAAPSLSPELLDHLTRQEWPGNVRELRNFIERLVVMADGDAIGMELLETILAHDSRAMKQMGAGRASSPPAAEPDSIRDFRDARNEFEANYLRTVLRTCRGNVSEAAKRAGMSRRSFYEKVEKLRIDLSEFKEES